MSQFIFIFMGVFFFACGYIIGKAKSKPPVEYQKMPLRIEKMQNLDYFNFLNYDGSEQE